MRNGKGDSEAQPSTKKYMQNKILELSIWRFWAPFFF